MAAAAANSASGNTRDSDTQLIEELEELTQTLYQSHVSSSSTTTRRTASLALLRTDETTPSRVEVEDKFSSRARSRRMSLSPWRSRPKLEDQETEQVKVSSQTSGDENNRALGSAEKKGIWNWKPIRALSHIGMQKTTTLFSVEVVAAQGLPTSMNGLRLSVCVRKKETKEGAVQTMPSRVSQGSAEFEETLFVKCHVYCNKMMKFEPRPFLIYIFAVDAEELNFGRSSVDLSQLIEESVEKSFEGKRVRQWDRNLTLSGKAGGGELVVKIGFQIMEKDGGVGIYGRAEGAKIGRDKTVLFSFARKQSKTSFSIPSSSRRFDARTPSMSDIRGMDHLNLDEPTLVPKTEDLDLPDFEVVDKGVEEAKCENTTYIERSRSSEVDKETVKDQLRQTRLTELDSIAKQIKALEYSMVAEDEEVTKAEEGVECQRLDANEETVTMEFLHLLEEEEERKQCKLNQAEIPPLNLDGAEAESRVYVPDLGKGLGCVVQTRNGGYLGATNPLDTLVSRKEAPKLAMQISKPLVISTSPSSSGTTGGLELLQRMAGLGVDELSAQLLTLMPMDELIGKTAEQIAFEGIASAIIQGRNKEGATSSAARTVAAVKSMAAALTAGRKQRIATGIWNVAENEENPLTTVEEIVAFSLQRIEAMAVEALKIQADMAEEDAPFEMSPIVDQNHLLMNSAVKSDNTASGTTISLIVQLRDPLRRFEDVGGPVIALIQATRENRVDESRYRVTSVDVAGLMVRNGGRRSAWDGDKQRLTAMQWLVEYGLGMRRKKRKQEANVKGRDLVWSISSRVMEDLWLETMRNPDVKFAE